MLDDVACPGWEPEAGSDAGRRDSTARRCALQGRLWQPAREVEGLALGACTGPNQWGHYDGARGQAEALAQTLGHHSKNLEALVRLLAGSELTWAAALLAEEARELVSAAVKVVDAVELGRCGR